MSSVNRITELVQAYHDDNFNNRSAMDSAAGDMLYKLCDLYGLEYPDDSTVDAFAKLMRPVIEDSVDWQQIADDDENAREWDEARREAIYGRD